MIASFRRVAAGESHEVCFRFLVKFWRLAGAWSIVEGTINPAFMVVIARSLYGASAYAEAGGDGVFSDTVMAVKEDAGAAAILNLEFGYRYMKKRS